MNTEKFTGKSGAYAAARPGYSDAAIEYIRSLVPSNAVFADIGAGTGKFTELIARHDYEVFAVEPNADMREQLAITLASYPNAKIANGTAEATTLPDHSVDVITCAQALHWFDPNAFRNECLRIGKTNALVIAVYNNTPGGSSITHSKQSTEVFFHEPTVREFPNPQFYTRESWLQFMLSHSHDPLPTDDRYDAHIAEMNAIFDRENVDGLLRRDVVTKVYSERLGKLSAQNTASFIGGKLIGNAQKDAADFFEFLLDSGFQFERGSGYWADKLYWMIKYKGEYICFVLISDCKDNIEPNGWVIWTDDSGSNWFEDSLLDEHIKEVAWNHIDICGNCGGCKNPGGSHKTIFGKRYDNVCITAMRFDNPDAETVECVKKLVSLRKNDIIKKTNT